MKCKVEGCDKEAHKKCGKYCRAHYFRLYRYGRSETINREKGTGSVGPDGYVRIERNNKVKMAHILVAEKALGKPLPKGAEVHHVNGIRSDNRNENLVICPTKQYHWLLHRRAKQLG